MRPSASARLMAVLACAALALAGCGSSNDTPQPSTPAATPAGPDLGAAPRPETAGYTVTRFEYPTEDEGDTTQNWADFYLPSKSTALDSVPLVVLIHGGAWSVPLGANIFEPLAHDLAQRGMAVYNIEYRRVGSGGGWPTTFRDVAHALDAVVDVDKLYPQITTDDELVVGHSAGAQLAVWGGTRNKLDDDEVGSHPRFRPTRVVSLAGPLDMIYAVSHGDDRIVKAIGGTPREHPARYASVDPIQNLSRDVPVVAIHGDADKVVPVQCSARYVAAAKKNGGTAQFISLPGVSHSAIVSSNAPTYPRILDIIARSAAA